MPNAVRQEPGRVESLGKRSLLFYWFLWVISGLVTLVNLLSIPGDLKNSQFFGYSALRIAVVGFVILLIAAAIVFLVGAWRNSAWCERFIGGVFYKGWAFWGTTAVSMILFLTGWAVLRLPDYLIPPGILAYYDRLLPVITWVTWLGVQTAILFPLMRFGVLWGKMRSQKTAMIAGVVFVALFLLVGLFVCLTGIGITPDPAGWVHPGVPLLSYQVFLAVVLGISILLIQMWFDKRGMSSAFRFRWIDVLLCLLIWVLAVFAWSRINLQPGHFAPDPRPPNNEYYPYSDSATYGKLANGILLGNGFANGGVVPRPLYILFLTMLHLLAGNHYADIVFWQVVFLAVFPVLLFLLGRSVQGRPLGIIVAMLAIFREANAIASTPYIRVSHSKLFMSDLPAAVGVVILTWLVFRWLRGPERGKYLPLLTGGALGLLMLVRTQSAVFLPFIAIGAIFAYHGRFRHWGRDILLLCLGLVLSIAPWLVRNYINTGQVAFDSPSQSAWVAGRFGMSLSWEEDNIPIVSGAPSPLEIVLSEPDLVAQFVGAHSINNALGTALVLPVITSLEDLEHSLLVAVPFYNHWEKGVSLADFPLLIVNLIFACIGLGAAWQRWRVAGIMPFVLFIGYDLSNALARNSGWRYMLPVDWVSYFYFCLGVLTLAVWVFYLLGSSHTFGGWSNTDPSVPLENKIPKLAWYKVVLWGSVFLVLGASIPLSEMAFPRRYTEQPKLQVWQELVDSGVLDGKDIDSSKVQAMLADDQSVALVGKAFYPRFYKAERGESSPYMGAYAPRLYPRLAFLYIGSSYDDVVLPVTKSPVYFPNASEVVVIGCKGDPVINAWLVVVKGRRTAVYLRNPMIEPACPMQEPAQ